MFDQDDCPFILTVSVFPHDNPVPERHLQVRCTFDTGCVQGNIISQDLAQRLGYTKFDKLKPREQNGGTTVIGDWLKPIGAIHLSWYHSTSPQVFQNMRFLVLADARVDLLIGVHSIVRHGIISPPNFPISVAKGVVAVTPGDNTLQALKRERSKCKTKLEDLERELGKKKKEGSDQEGIKILEKGVTKASIKYEIAEEKCTLHKIRKQLPNNGKLRNAEKVSLDKIAELEGKEKCKTKTKNKSVKDSTVSLGPIERANGQVTKQK